MNKKGLAKLYIKVSKSEISIKKALEEIDIFLKTMQEALIISGKVKFMKKGTFEVLKKEPRIISNPSTRELMKIYPKKVVRFRASKNIMK
ncbi:HU family DNA-binding protein [Fusobacterium varium]|uniref:HU family DNA-binding protein n=1 Tax=Fusobacterium varium TaxID=856 RepID=UPI001F1D7171|nr:HU family DNA-binding protein [Fusobacterium varium]MCF2674724.1 HU family DNA-binding protein [Fusobacterium varium]